MRATRSSAQLRGEVERSACDRETSELLQIVLRRDVANLDHIDTITRLIDSGQIAAATERPDALADLVDLPPNIIRALVATLEIARRASLGQVRPVICGPADVAAIARRELGGRTRECVLAVICDASNQVIRTMIVAQGSADTVPMPVREVLNAVLRCDGRAFAIAHNHPAGVVGSSDADVSATERLAVAARTVGLRFLGHVVVAGDHHEMVGTVSGSRTPSSGPQGPVRPLCAAAALDGP